MLTDWGSPVTLPSAYLSSLVSFFDAILRTIHRYFCEFITIVL